MKSKIATIGLMSAGALLLASVNAAADDFRRETTTTTTERIAPMPPPIESESYRRHTHSDPLNGTVVEEESRKVDATGSSTTTTVTQKNYTGIIKQIEPSRTVMIVDGTPYDIRGPLVSEVTSHVGQNVTVVGRLDAPTRTIEIERWESQN